MFHNTVKEEDQFKIPGLYRDHYNDDQHLKHVKLSFPVFKEGSDSMEGLRDCEEYFRKKKSCYASIWKA